jgi:hypothetical protein
MNSKQNATKNITNRAVALVLAITLIAVVSTRMRADTGTCGEAAITLPFTDVPASNIFFCVIASAYFTGLTNGTSPTTYNPAASVPREQMAAFITRTLDQSLRRGNLRAALQQWWRPTSKATLRPSSVGTFPAKITSDGTDIWVASTSLNAAVRVRASDGRFVDGYDPADGAHDIIVAAGMVFLTGLQGPSTSGKVYRIDLQLPPPGQLTHFADTGPNPTGITFDGTNLWTANNAGGLIGGSITRIPLDGMATTFAAGFTAPADILWDGENLWVADFAADRVRRLNPVSGAVLQSIVVGNAPRELLFDGANLWVSNFFDASITVIRAVGGLRGTVLATLTGNGIDGPAGLAFDGERVLVANLSGDSVSLFKAADFTPLGNLPTGTNSKPVGACSDGLNFWITSEVDSAILRF